MQKNHKLIQMAFFDRNSLLSSSSLHLDDQCMCFPDSSKEVFPAKFPGKVKGLLCVMFKRTTLLRAESPSSPQSSARDDFHPCDTMWVTMTIPQSCISSSQGQMKSFPATGPALRCRCSVPTRSEGTEQNQRVTITNKCCRTFSIENHLPGHLSCSQTPSLFLSIASPIPKSLSVPSPLTKTERSQLCSKYSSDPTRSDKSCGAGSSRDSCAAINQEQKVLRCGGDRQHNEIQTDT